MPPVAASCWWRPFGSTWSEGSSRQEQLGLELRGGRARSWPCLFEDKKMLKVVQPFRTFFRFIVFGCKWLVFPLKFLLSDSMYKICPLRIFAICLMHQLSFMNHPQPQVPLSSALTAVLLLKVRCNLGTTQTEITLQCQLICVPCSNHLSTHKSADSSYFEYARAITWNTKSSLIVLALYTIFTIRVDK